MTKAEQRALEAYPVTMVRRRYDGVPSNDDPYDSNLHDRYCFQRGYEQSEKDLVATIRAEVERRMGTCDADSKTPNQLLWAELAALIPFLDSLEEKNP